jgi:hypothetical protein
MNTVVFSDALVGSTPLLASGTRRCDRCSQSAQFWVGAMDPESGALFADVVAFVCADHLTEMIAETVVPIEVTT